MIYANHWYQWLGAGIVEITETGNPAVLCKMVMTRGEMLHSVLPIFTWVFFWQHLPTIWELTYCQSMSQKKCMSENTSVVCFWLAETDFLSFHPTWGDDSDWLALGWIDTPRPRTFNEFQPWSTFKVKFETPTSFSLFRPEKNMFFRSTLEEGQEPGGPAYVESGR